MRLLLDTHVLLWWLANDGRLGRDAYDAIAEPDNLVAVSAASAWEIAIKRAIGKLTAPEDLEEQLKANSIVQLPITVSDALVAGALPLLHADPFDRMLVAQARTGKWTLMTRDENVARYDVALLCV